MGADSLLVHSSPRVVSVLDRGLAYGDGLFETMLCDRGLIPLLEAHLARLADGARRLAMPLRDDAMVRLRTACQCLAMTSSEKGVIKLILTRGQGGRGYRPDATLKPQAYLTRHPCPALPLDALTRGVECALSTYPVTDAGLLCGLKTLNRLDQVMAASELSATCFEALMLDRQGRIVEGTRTNLFFRLDRTWFTPPETDIAVSGIMRSILIKHGVKLLGGGVESKRLPPSLLASCSGLFLCSSVLGVVPVRAVGCVEIGLDWNVDGLLHALSNHESF